MHQHFSFTRPLGLSFAVGIALALGFSGFGVAWAQNDTNAGAANIVYLEMDALRGKKLFAERGCVVCHAVNKVVSDIACK